MFKFTAIVVAVAICSPVWADDDNSQKSIQITTPDGICTSVSRVESGLVFLATRKGTCKAESIPVMVDKDVFQVKVFVNDKLWQEQGLVPAAVPDMERMQAQSRSFADGIKLPDQVKNKEAAEAGKKMGTFVQSDAYQARVMAEAERIRNDILDEPGLLKKFYPDGKVVTKNLGNLGNTERVYVFISSSMPLQTLRNYANSIDKGGDRNVVFVLRGMIGGISKLLPTMDFIGSILVKDSGCLEKSLKSGGSIECSTYGAEVLIDPMLFLRYEIVKVPAVVYATGVKPFDADQSEGFEANTQVGSSKTVYGDASLDGIIETIADNTKSKSLEALLLKMRAGYY
jgi:type-F conjugative transfer system pilin assembly protein TrbC